MIFPSCNAKITIYKEFGHIGYRMKVEFEEDIISFVLDYPTAEMILSAIKKQNKQNGE